MIIYGTALGGSLVKSEFPPGNVTGFRTIAEDEQIVLKWQDPDDTTVGNAAIARWAGTKIVRKEGGYPDNESDGAVVTDSTVRNQYSENGFVDTGLVNGVEYYYQAFPYSDSGTVNSDLGNRVTAKPQKTPPQNVTSFVAKPGNEQISLTWRDPEDVGGDAPVVWAGTKIVRKEGSYPENEIDGAVAVDSTVRNQYQEDGFVDEGLKNGVAYYYQAYPYSATGSVNRGETNRVQVSPSGIAPGNVQKFTVGLGVGRLRLRWTDPDDGVWAGTKVVRKTGDYPVDETDGVLVVNSTEKNQYQTNAFVDEGLTNGVVYFYQAFPYAETGAVNRNEANRGTAESKETPTYNYTGSHTRYNSTHPTKGTPRFYAILRTSGTFTLDMEEALDVFLCGGGGSGLPEVETNIVAYIYWYGSGAGGGRTTTFRNVPVKSSVAVAVTVGAGGSAIIGGIGGTGGTSYFGSYSVAGGTGSGSSKITPSSTNTFIDNNLGFPGGSGGGGTQGGNGGYNGASGGSGDVCSGGSGQGTTTRAFGGDISPFNTMYYGPGGGASSSTSSGSGGTGGGGKGGCGAASSNTVTPVNGTAYTGGGAGGGCAYYNRGIRNNSSGSAAGGSGIVIIRWGDWSA